MNRHLVTAICLSALALCSCESGEKTKKKPSSKSLDEVKLSERLGRKPDQDNRSHYEKYLPSATGGRGSAGTQFQKQMYKSATIHGTNTQATGLDGKYKTNQSAFSRWKFWGQKGKFAEAGKSSSATSKVFDPGTGGFDAAKAAREGSQEFSGASNTFGTKSALSDRDRLTTLPNAKSIDSISTTNSYSEDEVKKLLNRN